MADCRTVGLIADTRELPEQPVYSSWKALISSIQNTACSPSWLPSLQENGSVRLETAYQCYTIRLVEKKNVQVNFSPKPHDGLLGALKDFIFRITHFPVLNNYSLFGETSPQVRIEHIKQQTEKMLTAPKVVSITNTIKVGYFSYSTENKPREDREYGDTVKINNEKFIPANFSAEFIANIQSKTVKHNAGSTACLALVTCSPEGDIAITATNLGDSGLVLLAEKSDGSLLTIRLTEDHKPNLPRMQKHIETMGGSIIHDGVYRVTEKGAKNMLAVAAALGDGQFKSLMRTPDIIELKKGSMAYEKLNAILQQEKLDDVQQLAADGKLRLVVCSDGIESSKRTAHYDYVATFEGTEAPSDKNYNLLEPGTAEAGKSLNPYFEQNRGVIFNHEAYDEKLIKTGSDDVTLVYGNPGVIKTGEAMILSVFDGHHGEETSDFAQKALKEALKKAVS